MRLLKKRNKTLNPNNMLRWSIIFLVAAVIAAICGFSEIELLSVIAKVLFFIFLALFVVMVLFGSERFKH
jgi:uncharacterized membrane protein YtjA (UPF0391 family)